MCIIIYLLLITLFFLHFCFKYSLIPYGQLPQTSHFLHVTLTNGMCIIQNNKYLNGIHTNMIKKDRETKYFQLTIWYVPRWCRGRAFGVRSPVATDPSRKNR